MEKKVSPQNIAFLILSFLLGFVSHMYLLHKEQIDIFSILNQSQNSVVIDEIVDDEKELQLCEPVIEQEQEYNPCPILVDVSGAVKSPGVYCFEEENSVIDAVKKAKGFTSDAGFKYISMRINLATKLLSNTKIYIPFETDYDCKLLNFNLPKEVIQIATPEIETPLENSAEQSSECISINEGTAEQLQILEGVGPSIAQKIIDGRPYEVLEDLLNVSGIGEATFNKFKENICL
jgi:competence protein ComEA